MLKYKRGLGIKAQGRGGGKRERAIPPLAEVSNPEKADTGFLTPGGHA